MSNYVNEIPYELPGYIVAPARQARLKETDFAMAVQIGRRKPLPIGRLTLKDNNDVELVKSSFLATEIQQKAWAEMVKWLTGVEGLPVKELTVSWTM